VTLATPPFGKFFGVMSGQPLGTRVSNLKSVALTVLELLAFNFHDRPLRAHTHTHTHTHTQTDKHKRTHYLRHSLRSLGGDKHEEYKTVQYAGLPTGSGG